MAKKKPTALEMRAEALHLTDEELASCETGGDLEALVVRLEASGRGVASATVTEVIPAPEKQDWSAHDPACMDRLIRACITASLDGHKGPAVFEQGRTLSGCPPEVYYAIRADARFTVRYRQLVQEEVVLPGLAVATQGAMADGGAYGMAQSLNTAPKEDISDDEKRRQASYAKMGPADLVREIDRREAILRGFRDRLMAGASPPPDRIAQIQQEVVSVMDPPKRTHEPQE